MRAARAGGCTFLVLNSMNKKVSKSMTSVVAKYTSDLVARRVAIPELETMIDELLCVRALSKAPVTAPETLSLAQRCHPGAGVDADYASGTGIVTLSCHQCQRPITELCVALCVL
jgi:hypothetical protein